MATVTELPLVQTEEGLPPFRLQEPISSLALTPFAARAAHGSKVSTVGELAVLVFERDKECLSMGQGHIEEIRRKIEQFVGKPPYAQERHIDISSLLRLALIPLEGLDRGIIAIRCQLHNVATLSPQEIKEAEMALLSDRDGKFTRAMETAQQKIAAPTLSFLEQVFKGLIRPWLDQRGGVTHECELKQFCFEKSKDIDYATFGRVWVLFERLLNTPFLFSSFLCHVRGKVWAFSEKEALVRGIISDAQALIREGQGGANLKELARALSRCRLAEWEECTPPTVARILFWSFTDFSDQMAGRDEPAQR